MLRFIATCHLYLAIAGVGLAQQALFPIESQRQSTEPGQYVLCPSIQFYESAIEKGADKTTFIYYAAKMVKPEAEVSTVRNLAGRDFSLPNQLIIPIPNGRTASVGDILVSWRQSGSGIQRCIVVGGTKTEKAFAFGQIRAE